MDVKLTILSNSYLPTASALQFVAIKMHQNT